MNAAITAMTATLASIASTSPSAMPTPHSAPNSTSAAIPRPRPGPRSAYESEVAAMSATAFQGIDDQAHRAVSVVRDIGSRPREHGARRHQQNHGGEYQLAVRRSFHPFTSERVHQRADNARARVRDVAHRAL